MGSLSNLSLGSTYLWWRLSYSDFYADNIYIHAYTLHFWLKKTSEVNLLTRLSTTEPLAWCWVIGVYSFWSSDGTALFQGMPDKPVWFVWNVKAKQKQENVFSWRISLMPSFNQAKILQNHAVMKKQSHIRDKPFKDPPNTKHYNSI